MNHKLSFFSIDTLFYKCINCLKLFYMYKLFYIKYHKLSFSILNEL